MTPLPREASAARFFVTATDTGAGKTYFSVLFLRAAKRRNIGAAALKPLCCGGEGDLDALLAELPVALGRGDICHASFPAPAAPLVAAELAGETISPPRLVEWCRGRMAAAQVCLVEGVGGWMVPIRGRWCMADFAAELGVPVLLVVPDRLGCINHALLTANDILRRGVPFAGIVLNRIPGSVVAAGDNRRVLEKDFGLPVLGAIPEACEVLPDALFQKILHA